MGSSKYQPPGRWRGRRSLADLLRLASAHRELHVDEVGIDHAAVRRWNVHSPASVEPVVAASGGGPAGSLQPLIALLAAGHLH
jgi:hypothetical protein